MAVGYIGLSDFFELTASTSILVNKDGINKKWRINSEDGRGAQRNWALTLRLDAVAKI
jgi:hypothetical protein